MTKTPISELGGEKIPVGRNVPERMALRTTKQVPQND